MVDKVDDSVLFQNLRIRIRFKNRILRQGRILSFLLLRSDGIVPFPQVHARLVADLIFPPDREPDVRIPDSLRRNA